MSGVFSDGTAGNSRGMGSGLQFPAPSLRAATRLLKANQVDLSCETMRLHQRYLRIRTWAELAILTDGFHNATHISFMPVPFCRFRHLPTTLPHISYRFQYEFYIVMHWHEVA
jgi:hypothetical protein